MQRVLTTGANDEPDEVVDEAELEDVVEPEEPESAPAEPEEEPEEEGEGEPEAEEDEPPEEEAAEGEGEPAEPVAAHEEEESDFYLGRYKTREEAERGWLEKEQMISRQGDELHRVQQEMAELRGFVQGQQQSDPGDFEAWAEAKLEGGDAWGGASEALDAALSSGDPVYVDAYIEQWKEVDPFEAARFRTMVDTQIAQAQAQAQQASQPPPAQEVINSAWLEVAETDPDLRDPEFAAAVGGLLKGNPALRAAALSGDPELVRSSIAIARDGVRMQSARPGKTGTPRKVRSSDAEQLRKDKLDASVTTGDSSPERGNGSTPEVPAELQEMLQRVQAGEGGFPKLRE